MELIYYKVYIASVENLKNYTLWNHLLYLVEAPRQKHQRLKMIDVDILAIRN